VGGFGGGVLQPSVEHGDALRLTSASIKKGLQCFPLIDHGKEDKWG
jgi:hypothetical protein